jgi:glyoxylase-like metal-dependent hydrolase (beta-lactamase superfamily II)
MHHTLSSSIRLAVRLSLAATGLVLCTVALGAQPARGRQVQALAAPAQPDFSQVQVLATRVQGNVYMLEGAGGNVTVQVGEQGVLVVDTQFAPMADKLLAEIRKLAGDKPIRFVIDTHGHPDHVGGNERMRRSGTAVFGGNVRNDDPRGEQGAVVIAHENVQFAMVKAEGTPQATPEANWPTETYTGDQYDLFFNDEAVQLLHQPAAHTDGDTMVFFRKSDVLSTGDVFVTNGYPFIDRAHGGSIGGILNALNRILDITVPRDKQEGGTMVIPGHGRICDEGDVVEYRDMITIIRDRIAAMVAKGMNLEQVRAARPTRDYDGRYGATSGFWTTDMFIEAVYAGVRDGAGAGK